MRARFGIGLMALLLLAGCGQQRVEDLLVACPALVLPADAADMTRYRPGAAEDLSALVLDARIQGLSGGCARGSRDRSVDVTLTARFSAERGPASSETAVDLPWFLAVVEQDTGRIISRQAFTQRVVFRDNMTRAVAASREVNIRFPVGEGRRVQDHAVVAGFVLTAEELALNRRRGPR